MKSVLSFYSFYRIIVKFFYLKSLLDPVPKNEIQIFFSFLNHLITKHSDDLVFRILVFQKVKMYDLSKVYGASETSFFQYMGPKEDVRKIKVFAVFMIFCDDLSPL